MEWNGGLSGVTPGTSAAPRIPLVFHQVWASTPSDLHIPYSYSEHDFVLQCQLTKAGAGPLPRLELSECFLTLDLGVENAGRAAGRRPLSY